MIKVSITKDAGRLVLSVDARDFHAELERIGVQPDGNTFKFKPPTNASIGSGGKLSTEVLLRREYPAKFDLTGYYTTPPTLEKMKALCASAEEAARKILDHYQPVDISIEIQKKLIG